MKFIRKLMCRIGLCAGYVDHQKINGVWMIGLRCIHCGKLHAPIQSRYQDKEDTK